MAEKKLGAIHYNWPGYDLEGFAQRASEIGYTHCEVRASDIWTDDAVDGAHRAEEVRALLARYGMQISAVEIGNDFLQAAPADLDAQVARYKARCKVIPLTGCDIARSDGGWNRLAPFLQRRSTLREPGRSTWTGRMRARLGSTAIRAC